MHGMCAMTFIVFTPLQEVDNSLSEAPGSPPIQNGVHSSPHKQASVCVFVFGGVRKVR